ncbi:hypothetical protein SADUNF_Sadunf01G0183100 [Salix dunnii]|uniref:Uncharacterized protein n=1 Tax=Salix dunnii TaxID=1413687 RepID=A0A835TP76_9ROSI|nr:hypothetical protein SADUNF_Sadunf01G0183100 [Salix dunnii]
MMLRTPPAKRTRGVVAENAIPIIESPQSDHHHLVINEDNSIRRSNLPPPNNSSAPTSAANWLNLILQTCSSEKQARDYQSKLEELNENFFKSGSWLELELYLTKEDRIQVLKNNLHAQKEVNNHQWEEIKTLNDMLNNEARRIKSLERESDQLRAEISLFSLRRLFDIYIRTKFGFFQLREVDNEAKQSIKALRTELQKTKEKLQAVEELKSQSGYTGKLVDSYISGKITRLKEQIATLEKREKKYKTVFADRISVLQRAFCELFGYKVLYTP